MKSAVITIIAAMLTPMAVAFAISMNGFVSESKDEWVKKQFSDPPKNKDALKFDSEISKNHAKVRDLHINFENRYYAAIKRLTGLRNVLGKKVDTDKTFIAAVKEVAAIGKSKLWRSLDSAEPYKIKAAEESFPKLFAKAEQRISDVEGVYSASLKAVSGNNNTTSKRNKGVAVNLENGLPVESEIVDTTDHTVTYLLPDGNTKTLWRPQTATGKPLGMPIGGATVIAPGATHVFINPQTGKTIKIHNPDTRTKREKNQEYKFRRFEAEMERLKIMNGLQ